MAFIIKRYIYLFDCFIKLLLLFAIQEIKKLEHQIIKLDFFEYD